MANKIGVNQLPDDLFTDFLSHSSSDKDSLRNNSTKKFASNNNKSNFTSSSKSEPYFLFSNYYFLCILITYNFNLNLNTKILQSFEKINHTTTTKQNF